MRIPLTLVSLLLGATMLAVLNQSAQAHGCLHARVKCKAWFHTNSFEFVHPHSQTGQYLNASCFKSGGFGFNVAEAFSHSSQHTNGNTHINGWGWSAGVASYSWHASHGHCSDHGESDRLSHNKPRLLPPPRRADSEGAFSFANLEALSSDAGLLLRFLPGSQLQVDTRGLVRRSDRSESAIKVDISGQDGSPVAAGKIVLGVGGEDSSPTISAEGIYSDSSNALQSLEVEPDPVTPGVFFVELGGTTASVAGGRADDIIEVDGLGFQDGREREHGKAWVGADN